MGQMQKAAVAEKAFGALNGWSIAGTDFSLRMLAEQKQNIGMRHLYMGDERRGLTNGSVFDHTRFYKAGRIPMCVIAMPYSHPDRLDRVAAVAAEIAGEFGLKVCEPPDRVGWWNSGTQCFAFVRPGVMVRWLKEQGGGVS